MFEGPIAGTQRLALKAPEIALDVLSYAVERGICWLETADVWGAFDGQAETLVGQIRASAPSLKIATRGGLVRDGQGFRADGRYDALVAACEASCRRLDLPRLPLYQLHAIDPRTPLSEQLRALSHLLDRGYVEAIGLCHVRVDDLKAALDEIPVASVGVEISPMRPHSARSGVIEAALARSVRVLAYRPFGGHQGRRALERDPVLNEIAAAHRRTIPQIVLAWARALGLHPVCGPTSERSIDDLIDAQDLSLSPDALAQLDARFEPGRLLRKEAPARPLDPSRRVIVVMGRPGAGKTTRALSEPEGGFVRLNRDTRGGTLDDLLPPLHAALEAGAKRVVLDNTYPSRASRRPVIEAGRAHGVPVDCLWMTTSEDDAEINIVCRILDTIGYLPEPSEFEALCRAHPGIIPPRAASRYRQDFEPPSLEEGFASVEAIPFVRAPDPDHSGRALVLDPDDLTERNRERLAQHASRGFLLVAVGWRPAERALRERLLAEIEASAEALGLSVLASICTHPPGPPLCWCRKPLPGLLVAALRQARCDPRASLMWSLRPNDRSLARKLGIPLLRHGAPAPR